jgi:hypothetical protein
MAGKIALELKKRDLRTTFGANSVVIIVIMREANFKPLNRLLIR